MKSILKMAATLLFMSGVSLMACDTCAKHAKKYFWGCPGGQKSFKPPLVLGGFPHKGGG